MKKFRRFIFTFFAIAFLLPVSLSAADFGVLLDQSAGIGGTGDDPAFSYDAAIIPRFSSPLGVAGDLYLSASMTLGYEDKEFFYIPELLRSELSWRFGDAKITAGRMQYSSPFAYVAEGLLDGFQFLYVTESGTFNAGAWYTGLLYKNKANITMTKDDLQAWAAAVDYGDFAGTYFASRRFVAALGWEHSAIAELVRTKAAVVAQFDLNKRDNYLHSQYLTAKAGIPVGQFMFELGGAIEFAETAGDPKIGLAGELGIVWALPTSFPSRLSLDGYFSSGTKPSGSLAAFTPITNKFCGSILEALPSGISALSLDYTARLHKTITAVCTSTYFIRSDLGTHIYYPVDLENSDEHFLGNEFFAQLIWSPVSDLQINLGGGVFLPVMGNAAPDREPLWRIKLSALLAIY